MIHKRHIPRDLLLRILFLSKTVQGRYLEVTFMGFMNDSQKRVILPSFFKLRLWLKKVRFLFERKSVKLLRVAVFRNFWQYIAKIFVNFGIITCKTFFSESHTFDLYTNNTSGNWKYQLYRYNLVASKEFQILQKEIVRTKLEYKEIWKV